MRTAAFRRGQAVPVLNELRLRRKLGSLRHHTESDLLASVSSRSLSQPASNLPLYLAIHSLGNVEWRMHSARRKIHEERLVGRQRLDRPHPVDCLVGHVRHEMIVGIARRLDLNRSIIDRRRPLIGFAGDEAVEFVKARAGGPAIERSNGADLPWGSSRDTCRTQPFHTR